MAKPRTLHTIEAADLLATMRVCAELLGFATAEFAGTVAFLGGIGDELADCWLLHPCRYCRCFRRGRRYYLISNRTSNGVELGNDQKAFQGLFVQLVDAIAWIHHH